MMNNTNNDKELDPMVLSCVKLYSSVHVLCSAHHSGLTGILFKGSDSNVKLPFQVPPPTLNTYAILSKLHPFFVPHFPLPYILENNLL